MSKPLIEVTVELLPSWQFEVTYDPPPKEWGAQPGVVFDITKQVLSFRAQFHEVAWDPAPHEPCPPNALTPSDYRAKILSILEDKIASGELRPWKTLPKVKIR